MHRDNAASPFNPLPPAVWLLVIPLIVVELAFQAGARGLAGGADAVGWRLSAVRSFGFFDTVFTRMFASMSFPLPDVVRLVSYTFLHAGFAHVVFAVVLTMALGKMVGEVWRGWALVLVWYASAAVGAVAYALALDGGAPLIGAYPSVFGLVGAFTFLLWVNLAAVGANKYRAFLLIGILLLVRLLFGVLFGGNQDWIAEVTGFATGFGLSFVVSPGAWPRVLEQVRRR